MAAEGGFGGFRPDQKDPLHYGWKSYKVAEIVDERGVQAHAYTERVVLEYMSEIPELKPYIARLSSALIQVPAGSSSASSSSSSMNNSSSGGINNTGTSGSSSSSSSSSGTSSSSSGQQSSTSLSEGVKLALKLERINGKSLHEILNARQLKVKEALQISCKLIEAVSLLHSRFGISHGDLKPDNIMIITKSKLPQLIDWGASRWGKNTKKVTQACGNISCASPQLLKCIAKKTQYDSVKNDVFALGMILSLIWTSVHSRQNMCGALGPLWDELCPGIEHNELYSAQRKCLEACEASNYSHLNGVPAFFRGWIQRLTCPDEKERPMVGEMLEELYTATILKSGERYQAAEFLEDPRDPAEKLSEREQAGGNQGSSGRNRSVRFGGAKENVSDEDSSEEGDGERDAVPPLEARLDPLPDVKEIVKMWPLMSKPGPKAKGVTKSFAKPSRTQQERAKSVCRSVAANARRKPQRLRPNQTQ
mmetsp:Transcript_16188/g.39979  ORF Transcript_16188/g.39979 Transcript_16188/m.39979 type:complete len:478 (+) Transcript_16188:319-1752(+)